jgi:hypothetical protein
MGGKASFVFVASHAAVDQRMKTLVYITWSRELTEDKLLALGVVYDRYLSARRVEDKQQAVLDYADLLGLPVPELWRMGPHPVGLDQVDQVDQLDQVELERERSVARQKALWDQYGVEY